jgi:hypothetical protein
VKRVALGILLVGIGFTLAQKPLSGAVLVFAALVAERLGRRGRA